MYTRALQSSKLLLELNCSSVVALLFWWMMVSAHKTSIIFSTQQIRDEFQDSHFASVFFSLRFIQSKLWLILDIKRQRGWQRCENSETTRFNGTIQLNINAVWLGRNQFNTNDIYDTRSTENCGANKIEKAGYTHTHTHTQIIYRYIVVFCLAARALVLHKQYKNRMK